MALDNNSVGFELYFKDNLTNPLAQATSKGVASLNKLEGAKGGLTKSSGGLMGSLGGLTGGLGAMLGPAALATGAVVALGAGLKQVISTGMDFTKVMSNVKALTGANAEEFKRLNDAAISLGASTSFSSSQVAEAMAAAAAGGLEVNEIISAMPGFLDLAASSNTDLARSVEIGMAQMNSFGLQAKDMTHIVDMMSFTTVKSATGMEDLADGLNYIGSAAASLKVPLSEVLSIQATLGDRGLKGSMATRSLSTALQKLSAPTKKMSETMQALNLDFFDSKGQFIGINNTIGLLETRMKGFTDEQKANTLSTLFGNEAFAEMSILLDKGSAGLKTLSAEIENSNGTAAKIAKTQLDNLSGDVEQFGGAWESLQLKMFGQGESAFRGLVQIGTQVLNALANSWEDLTAPIGEVWSIMKDICNSFQDIFRIFGGEDVNLLQLFFKGLAESIRMSLAPLKFMLSTIKLIVVNIKNIFSGEFSFKTFFVELGNSVREILLPIGDIFKAIFTLDWDLLKSGASSFRNNFSNFRNDFANRLNKKSDKSTTTESDNGSSTGEIKLDDLKPDKQMLVPNAALNGSTKTNGGIDVVGSDKGAGKSVVVTINNLINSLTVQGANLQQNIKDAVSQALTDAVRDFETYYA